MAKKQALKTLKSAKRLVLNHFTDGVLAEDSFGVPVSPRSPKAVNFCSIGGVQHIGGPGKTVAMKFLREAAKFVYNAQPDRYDQDERSNATNGTIMDVNDILGLDDVRKMFNRAIQLAKEAK